MNTIPDSSSQAASYRQVATGQNAPARFVNRNLHRVWQLRRMQATLLRPFRKALRPLLVWLRQDHVFVEGGYHGAPPVGVKLGQFGWETLALTLLLAPVAFIMLLPMLILIFPVVVIIGLACIIIAAMETDEGEAEHHSLAWHAMN
jgi:hypothetical protein